MQRGDWAEPSWQKYFEQNTWVFGIGLAYQFVHVLRAQAHYGGVDVSGRGTQKGDFLGATASALGGAQYTVLVDIKRPDSALVTDLYRNGVYEPSRDLAGGVCQLQVNCDTWAREGSVQPKTRTRYQHQGIFTYQPKGILVVGDSRQLDHEDKISTF